MARMSRLRPVLMRRMIYEPGGEGLATVCRAIDLDKGTFGSIWVLSRRAHGADAAREREELAGALGFFDRIDRPAANRILQRWRRNPDYLDLLRRVETPPPGAS